MNFKKINLKPIHYALIVFLIVFSIHVFAHFPEYPGWDGSVYLSNGEFFFGKVYLQDELRPPIISIIYGILLQFTKNIYFLNIVDIAIRGLSAVAVFYLGRKFLSDWQSTIASIFALVNPVALAIPIFMSEFIGIIFLCISLIAFFKITKKPDKFIKLNMMNKSNLNKNAPSTHSNAINYIVMFVCAMCAFLTRYPLLVYCIILLIWVVLDWKKQNSKNRLKNVSVAAAIAGVLLILWFIWNAVVYSDPFISIRNAFTHINYDAASMQWWFYFWGENSLPLILNVGLIFLVLGIYYTLNRYYNTSIKNKKSNLNKNKVTNKTKIDKTNNKEEYAPHATAKDITIIAAWLIAYLLFIIYTAHKLPRYLFYFLTFAYLIIFYGLNVFIMNKIKNTSRSHNSNTQIRIGITLLLIVFLAIPCFVVYPPRESYRAKEIYLEAQKLQSIIPSDAIIAADQSPQIAYASSRKTYSFLYDDPCKYASCPIYPAGFYKKYGCENISYVVTLIPLNASCFKELPKTIWNGTEMHVYEYVK